MLQTAEHVGCVTAGGDGQCGDDDDGDGGDGGVLCLLVSPGLPPCPPAKYKCRIDLGGV